LTGFSPTLFSKEQPHPKSLSNGRGTFFSLHPISHSNGRKLKHECKNKVVGVICQENGFKRILKGF